MQTQNGYVNAMKDAVANSIEMPYDLANPNGKIRDIHIHQADNGYVVSVGCKTFVVSEPRKLIHMLLPYLYNPREVEEAYRVTGKLPLDHTVDSDFFVEKEAKK